MTVPSQEKSSLSRRSFVKAAGVGAAALGLAGHTEVASAASAGQTGGARGLAPMTPLTGNPVNLYVAVKTVVVDGSGVGTGTFTVGNYGPNTTQSTAYLTVTTPFYVNFAASGQPAGFTVLYLNPSEEVPSIAQIPVPAGLAAGASLAFEVKFELAPNSPLVPAGGRASFTTSFPASLDTDTDLTRNTQQFYVIRPDAPPPPTGNVDLFYTYEYQTLSPSVPAKTVAFHFGNTKLLHPTLGPTHFTMFTPFYVNIGAPLPLGAAKLYSNANPAVPEILQVTLLPGLLPVPLQTVAVPLVRSAGAPSCSQAGGGIVTTTSPLDIDSDPSTSHHPYGVLLLS